MDGQRLVLWGTAAGVLVYAVYWAVEACRYGNWAKVQAAATALVAYKAVTSTLQITLCYQLTTCWNLQVTASCLTALELSLTILLQLLVAKGYCLFRQSLPPAEWRPLLMLIVLLGTAVVCYCLEPDTSYIVFLIDLGAVFYMLMNFLISTDQALTAIESEELHPIALTYIHVHRKILQQFHYRVLIYYSALMLRWVCVPVAYRPSRPHLALYSWLDVGLFAAETIAVLLLLKLMSPATALGRLDYECVEVADSPYSIPLLVPSKSHVSDRQPALVITPHDPREALSQAHCYLAVADTNC